MVKQQSSQSTYPFQFTINPSFILEYEEFFYFTISSAFIPKCKEKYHKFVESRFCLLSGLGKFLPAIQEVFRLGATNRCNREISKRAPYFVFHMTVVSILDPSKLHQKSKLKWRWFFVSVNFSSMKITLKRKRRYNDNFLPINISWKRVLRNNVETITSEKVHQNDINFTSI